MSYIVEISGPSGSGKTSLISDIFRMKNTLLDASKIVIVTEFHDDSGVAQVIPNHIGNILRHGILTDIILFPWSLCAVFLAPKFIKFSISRISLLQESAKNKIILIRVLFRKLGLYYYFKRKYFNDFLIIIDEGIFHFSHNSLMSTKYVCDKVTAEQFLSLVPKNDLTVIMNTSPETLAARLIKRNTYSPRINNHAELIDFARNSSILYEYLIELVSHKRRFLVLDEYNTKAAATILDRVGKNYS